MRTHTFAYATRVQHLGLLHSLESLASEISLTFATKRVLMGRQRNYLANKTLPLYTWDFSVHPSPYRRSYSVHSSTETPLDAHVRLEGSKKRDR